MLRLTVAFACAVALSLPCAVEAQFEELAGLIPNLFDRTIMLVEEGHQAHFVDASDALRESGILINSSVVSQLATFPISSSSGGFTYDYNEELGVFERTTASFGPIFGERAQTIGKGRWNFGFNVFAADFDSIDGLDLGSGEMDFSLTHLDVNNDGTTVETFFEGDFIRAEASVALSTNTAVLFGSYGVGERFDLAVAVPFVSVDLDARLDTEIIRNASEGFSDPSLHRFADDQDTQAFVAAGSASGVGDVLVRAKYNFAKSENAGLAAAIDLRLPTGDEDELLGTGATQTKVFLIGSARFGTFSPHVNVGYTFSSGGSALIGDLPEEINFNAGFDVAVHPRVTVAGAILWRTLLDTNQIRRREETFLFKPWNSTEVQSTLRPTLETQREDLNLILGSIGFRVNIAGEVLLSLNLAASLSDEGLQDEDVIPLIGIDYSF